MPIAFVAAVHRVAPSFFWITLMYYGMYIAAAGAFAQSQRMEVISHNVANVGTAGFKRELSVLQARAAEEIERGYKSPGMGEREDIGGGVRLTETLTDFSVGPMRQTGVNTDFALSDPDVFFAVSKDGEEHLTRAGNFQLRGDGTLVTGQGYPVLSVEGQPVQIDTQLPFEVTPRGEIVQAGEARPLALRRPQSLGDLVRVGENLFAPIGEPPASVAQDERRVHWQHLEMAAVQPHQEMISMIETSRIYEANVRMIQNHDTMLGGLLGRVLKG
jgi:flagellar basal-body rod protein FlgF